jgi:hypothetical protein
MKTKVLILISGLFVPFVSLAKCPDQCTLNVTETWISFLPVIFLFIILIVATFKLRSKSGKTTGLLTEKDKSAATIPGADDNAATPPQSASRAIAFITGLVALSIGTCLTTFYIYSYFADPTNKLDLSNLSNVIWGLGIGVIPYGFNKASAAFKPNS